MEGGRLIGGVTSVTARPQRGRAGQAMDPRSMGSHSETSFTPAAARGNKRGGEGQGGDGGGDQGGSRGLKGASGKVQGDSYLPGWQGGRARRVRPKRGGLKGSRGLLPARVARMSFFHPGSISCKMRFWFTVILWKVSL